MAVPTAEDGIKVCHVCAKQFEKQDVRIPTYREGRFWFECIECFEERGGVTWIGKSIPKYEVVRCSVPSAEVE